MEGSHVLRVIIPRKQAALLKSSLYVSVETECCSFERVRDQCSECICLSEENRDLSVEKPEEIRMP